MGIPWDRYIVANLETGRRRTISIEELLALAYVLSVAPVHLLVPPTGSAPLRHVPTMVIDPDQARRWIRGFGALDTDERIFFTEVPFQEIGVWPDRDRVIVGDPAAPDLGALSASDRAQRERMRELARRLDPEAREGGGDGER